MSDAMSNNWFEEVSHKECNICKQLKLITQFYKNNRGLHGRRPSCNVCTNEKEKQVLKADPERFKRYSRQTDLKKKYGISVSDYNALVEKQNGVCIICSQPSIRVDRDGISRLVVDHCHTTGKVRGLLCHNCNVALGLFKDDPDLLQKAKEYLQNV